MERIKMLEKLQSLSKPVVSDIGCFDTGIEFRILTKDKGYFCMGGGCEPIKGPFSENMEAYQALKKLINSGYQHELRCENWIEEYLSERDDSPVSQTQRQVLIDLEEEELDRLALMIEASFVPDSTYYTFQIQDGYDPMVFYKSLEEAEQALVQAFTASGGKAWIRMTNEELAEWFSYIEP